MAEIADAELVRRIAGGDREAFRLLWDRHAQPLLVFLISLCLHRQNAEDVLQQTFLKVFVRPGNFEHLEALQPYLFKTARNLMMDTMRKKDVLQLKVADEMDLFLPDWEMNPLIKAESRDQARYLQETIGSLSGEYREVVLLYNYAEMTFQQIAQSIEVPLQTVHSRYKKALGILKENLHGCLEF